ncbi:hypothetical protein [Luteolibacter soli]|uniref:hypothetical protein n=1 Tax=Luteolibacter soli TaxID=3135280 RepID=UPI00311A20F2
MWLLLLLPCSLPARAAEDEAWRAILGRWKQASEKEIKGVEDAFDLEASAKEVRAWISAGAREMEPVTERSARQKYSYIAFDFIVAKGWAAAGDYEKALRYLKAGAAQPGVFLHETRNPNYFALDVFKLHAEIMARTGKVFDIPYSGYQVFAGPSSKGVSRYAFVWEPEGDEIGSITVQGVDEDEQRFEITLLECGPDKRCRYGDSAQVVSKRGRLKVSTAERRDGFVLVLRGVTKFVEFKGELMVPFVRPSERAKIELRLDREDGIEQPVVAIARMGQI